MLLSISNNPAIDYTLVIPRFSVGKVHRASREHMSPGGKGLNVARAARVLGQEALCMGLLGGHHGRLLADLAAAEGLDAAFTWLETGETRACTIVLDDSGGEATVLNTLGPAFSAGDWERLSGDVLERARPGSAAIFAGSLPPNTPLNAYTALFDRLARAGCRAWIDSSGQTLKAALEHPPYGIKVNGREIGEAVEMTVEGFDAALTAAQAMRSRGVQAACVTLGEAGAVLVSSNGKWTGIAPQVKAISSVGSGDAFMAGLAAALQNNAAEDEALRWGIAAGAANTLSPFPGEFRLDDFEQLRTRVQVQLVSPGC